MRQIEWHTLSIQLCELARNAGGAIMQIYQDSSQTKVLVANKSDDSPLTLADLAAHHIIADGLARLAPDIPVVSEEDVESLAHRFSQANFWLIDPLDGTKEFLSRNGEFTVNIALISDGEPLSGVVYAPALDQMFWGGAAFGAFRQVAGTMTTIRVSNPVKSGQSFRVVASRSHLNDETSAFIEKLGATELVQAGSSLKFCRIAEGSADVYPRLAPTCEWDTAAAQAVLEGAGGYVYDIYGVRLRYGKADLVNPSFVAASVAISKLDRAE